MEEAEIHSYLPHAFEFHLIDGICPLDRERNFGVGYEDWNRDPWWACSRAKAPPSPRWMARDLVCARAADRGALLHAAGQLDPKD